MPEIADHHYDENHSEDGSGMAPRSCTDIVCLLVFIAFTGGMGYVSSWGLKNGDPRRLTHGFNYAGKLCGVDKGYEDRPLLYYCPASGLSIDALGIPTAINFKAPICVSECPKDSTLMMKCMRPTKAVTVVAGTPEHPVQQTQLQQGVVDTKSYATKEILGLYCMPDLEKISAIAAAAGAVTPSGLRTQMTGKDGPIGNYMTKAQQMVGSLRRCWMLLVGSLIFAVILGYTYLILLKLCAKPLIYVSLLLILLLLLGLSAFFFAGEVMPRPPPLTNATTTTTNSSGTVTVQNATAPGAPVPPAPPVTPAPALPVKPGATAAPTAAPTPAPALPVKPAATAAPTAAPTPAATPAATAAPTAAPTPAPVPRRLASVVEPVPVHGRRLLTYEEAKAQMEQRWDKFGGRKKWEELNPFYNEHMSPKDARMASLVTGGVFGVLALLFLVLLCCAGTAISTACGCVEAACSCMFAMPCMLVMPAIAMTIKTIVFAVLLYFFSYVLSSGEMDTKTYANVGGTEINGLRRHFKYSDNEKAYLAYFVFGIFWYLEFFSALGQFVVSYAVVGWYYIPNPKTSHNWCGLIRGYVNGLTFHMGTLALGSFLIAVFRFIRLILMAIQQKAKAEGNPVMACIAKCLMCCITCVQKFVEFINKNAYIDVCINSTNFCQAGKDALAFILGHATEITILNGACTIFAFAGCGLISGGTAYLTYFLCTTQERWTSETSPHHVASPRFVAVVALVGAAFIAHAFMTIFDVTADTLLYTYCWNKSKAHNTVQKFAPESLAKLTGYVAHKKPEPPAKKEEPQGFWQTMFGGGGGSERDPLIKK